MTSSGMKRVYIAMIVIAILITVASFSVSYFISISKGQSQTEAESAKLGLDLKVERLTSEKTIGLLPVEDNGLQSALDGINNETCVDDAGKGRCQIYKVTVTNSGNVTTTLSSEISLYATGEDSVFNNLKWAELVSPTDATPFGNIHTMNDVQWKKYFVMGPKSTSDFYIMIWLSNLDVPQNHLDDGNFAGTIKFNSTAGTGTNATFIG